jgi:malonate decarboxylase gamma subunit
MRRMTLAELTEVLFGVQHSVRSDAAGVVRGAAALASGRTVNVTGISGGRALGIEAALAIAQEVLEIMRRSPAAAILVVVDSGSQLMSRREELLGLNEALGHLIKVLGTAATSGHPTAGLLYGASSGGALIATGLAAARLAALAQAQPSVMELEAMARVVKLPTERLERLAADMPVFAPGVANFARAGAIHEIWHSGSDLGAQLEQLLASSPTPADTRARLGAERGGRTSAAAIIERIIADAQRN